MAKDKPVDMLGTVGLFEGLSRKELRQIHQMGKEVSFPAGRAIVKEGETGLGFHLILEGKAKVTIKGRRHDLLGPGNFFGELALIDRGTRTATVTAETPVRTLSIVSWDFLPMIEQNPSIARKLLLEMCRRLRGVRTSYTA